MNIPANNTVIVFTKTPAGSYASVNTPYLVNVNGAGRRATVFLRNVAKGSGTFDKAAMYCRAEWALAQ